MHFRHHFQIRFNLDKFNLYVIFKFPNMSSRTVRYIHAKNYPINSAVLLEIGMQPLSHPTTEEEETNTWSLREGKNVMNKSM